MSGSAYYITWLGYKQRTSLKIITYSAILIT